MFWYLDICTQCIYLLTTNPRFAQSQELFALWYFQTRGVYCDRISSLKILFTFCTPFVWRLLGNQSYGECPGNPFIVLPRLNCNMRINTEFYWDLWWGIVINNTRSNSTILHLLNAIFVLRVAYCSIHTRRRTSDSLSCRERQSYKVLSHMHQRMQLWRSNIVHRSVIFWTNCAFGLYPSSGVSKKSRN